MKTHAFADFYTQCNKLYSQQAMQECLRRIPLCEAAGMSDIRRHEIHRPDPPEELLW